MINEFPNHFRQPSIVPCQQCFATIMLCAFYGCHRMGELIIKSDKKLLDSRKLIKRSSLTFTNRHAQYRLPYHKADPFYRASDVVFSQHDVADPVQLLKFSCVKMGRFLIDPGLTGSFSLSYPMISGVIPPALGVPLILPLWAFQILSSKHSVIGLPRPGKFTFVTIPPFVLNNSLHLSAYSIHIINSGFSLHLFSPPPSPSHINGKSLFIFSSLFLASCRHNKGSAGFGWTASVAISPSSLVSLGYG